MPDTHACADLLDELEAERADHADTMKRAQEAWRVAEKLAAALTMARGFLGMAIKSPKLRRRTSPTRPSATWARHGRGDV